MANRGSDTVSVIDTSTNQVKKTINVGSRPGSPILGPGGIAVTPDGRRVLVVNAGTSSRNVSVIDTVSDGVTSTIRIARPGFPNAVPFGVAVHPDGTRAFVISRDPDYNGNGLLSVIALSSYTVVQDSPIELGDGPDAVVAVTPDGRQVWVGSGDACECLTADVVNSTTLAVLGQVHLPNGGGRAWSLVFGQDGNSTVAYIVGDSNDGSYGVSVVSTSSPFAVKDVIHGFFGVGIAMNRHKTRAYVTDGIDNELLVINTQNSINAVIASKAVYSPFAVAVTP